MSVQEVLPLAAQLGPLQVARSENMWLVAPSATTAQSPHGVPLGFSTVLVGESQNHRLSTLGSSKLSLKFALGPITVPPAPLPPMPVRPPAPVIPPPPARPPTP